MIMNYMPLIFATAGMPYAHSLRKPAADDLY
jgi:hypothetical protein